MNTQLSEAEQERTLAQFTEGLSPKARKVVAEALDISQDQIRAQRAAHLTLSASGIHPRDDGGVDLSNLVAGVIPVSQGPPSAILLTVAQQEEAREDSVQVHVSDFPAGQAVVAERRMSVPVQQPGPAKKSTTSEESDEPAQTVSLASIRVTFVAPGASHLAVVELTTKSVDAFSSYRDVVLELVAPSVTFEDPEQKAKQEHESSVRQERLADRLGGKTVEVGDTVTGDDADDADEGGEGDKND